ncbi:MAG: heavy metal-binding domain-containing protein, partial [Candidatus Micrarchaeota archaeon]
MAEDILVVTTNEVPGRKVAKVLGIASGLTARSRGVGGKFIAGIESMFGGEITAFTSEVEKAREEALERLKG